MLPPSDAHAADTIYALSSGRPPAAVAVIRVSGPAAGSALGRLAGSVGAPRRATMATLRDRDGAALDHALTLWFPGPLSATGEDVAELHVHGGAAVVEAVLVELGASGLRLAEPGEFTRRALLNGRLDLGEVEGLADLLSAETQAQRRQALARSQGALGRLVGEWTARVVELAAMAEAAIDYDDEADASEPMLRDGIAALSTELAGALALPPAERLRDGFRIAIVGPVNAGKSSLFNRLVGEAAAIVAATPGTTRDVIERPLAIDGMPIVLVDTAGVRDADEPVEREGIARAMGEGQSADLVLDLSPSSISDGRRIAVSAKIDLIAARGGTVGVSAVTGEGISALIAMLATKARTAVLPEHGVALTQRYRQATRRCLDEIHAAAIEADIVLVAERLRRARTALDAVAGRGGIDDVLDALFRRFCLGK